MNRKQFLQIFDDKDEVNEETSQPRMCNWCEKPLPDDYYENTSVCSNCQQLLRNAGISEEEIFGDKISLDPN